MKDLIGRTLGHYRIVEQIGAGGMGVVYRALDPRLDREIALKVLPAETLTDETARARMVREARLAARLNHPNVCTIHEVEEAEGQVYIAMELVEVSLTSPYSSKSRRLSPPSASGPVAVHPPSPVRVQP